MDDLLTLTPHPVADLFPMMSDDEYRELVENIRQHDQIEPIWTLRGQILDGRNRYRACMEIGIDPNVREYTGPDDERSLIEFVMSLNMTRRHLSSSQRAVVGLDVEKRLAVAARERQLSTLKQNTTVPELIPEGSNGEAREQAAAIVGTNARYVSDAKRIAAAAPDLLEKVRVGDITIPEAKREIKEREREQVREQNRALIDAAPPAVGIATDTRYQTIVLDPPWAWEDEGDADQFGRARPVYGTMPISEIAALPVGDLAADDAHIYLWITNRSLPKGFSLLDGWGFRYVTMLTWCKPSIGMGNYYRGSTEQVLFGVRGSLPLLRNDVGTWFSAPRPGRHSAKPPEFYALVESASPGPWLEMFARSERNGWASWGAEVAA